jgi:hypothetical protein
MDFGKFFGDLFNQQPNVNGLTPQQQENLRQP